MENSPELDGKYLGTITIDFVKIADVLKEAAYQLKARKISDFPIFPVTKGDSPVGELLIGAKEKDLQWNFFFSFLEDLLQKEVISTDRKEYFLQSFKDPGEYCCLFVIDEGFQNFIYIPYPEDQD